MSGAQGGPPPGWYPDPTGQYAYRRWDGERWTTDAGDEPSGEGGDEAPRDAGAEPAPPDAPTGAEPLGPPPGSPRARAAEGTRARLPVPVLVAVAVVVAVVAVVAVVVLRASDGDGDGDATAEPGAADQFVAEESMLALGDLPDSWRAGPSDPEATGFDGAGCEHLGRLAERFADGAISQAPNFRDPTGTAVVANTVVIARDDAPVAAFLADVGRPETGSCLEGVVGRALERTLGEEPALRDLGVERVAAAPLVQEFGDRSGGWRVAVDARLGGEVVTLYVDVVVVQVGRSLAAFSLQQAFDPFDDDVRGQLVGAVADRLRSGLGG